MDTISGYKDRAIASLSGKWGTCALAVLIYCLIIYAGSFISLLTVGDSAFGSVINIIWSLACVPLSWGLTVYFLDISRQNNPQYSQLFDGYKDFLRIILTYLCFGIAIGIGFLLLIVPGIIIALMFSQAPFILKDKPELSAIEVLSKSADMMKGHKMDLFLLGLSFIGWGILAMLTLGLGFFLLIPYMYTTFAHFYDDLKKEYAM
ncbi:MAG: DUF975 family protein [Prevotella sp.]|nr:DUF975 family protein [Prevotella sp.]